MTAMRDTQGFHELLGNVVDHAGDLTAFAESLSARHPTAIRIRSSLDRESLPFDLTPVPWYSRGYWLPSDQRPGRSMHHVAGDYYIQDAGSMLAIAACQIESGMRVCDLCAAPGGKATAIVDRLGDNGWLLANEPIAGRAAALEFNLSRTGSVRWAVSSLDPDRLADSLPGEFDLVLVDAPCSGQTLVGRGKQRQAAWSKRQIDHSALRQQRILDAAVRLLRPGGQLVYSTCTFAIKENEDQADRLIASYGMLPWKIDSLANYEVSSIAACYRLWPHQHPTAGAFAASLRKGTCVTDETAQSSTRRQSKSNTSMVSDLESWGTLENSVWLQRGQRVFAWPDDFPDRWLQVVTSGPEVAYQPGKTWQPAYSLALRNDVNWAPHQTVDLDTPTAKAFLSGQSLSLTNTQWHVVSWYSKPIAWGKGDGRRIRLSLSPAAHQLARSLE